MGGRIYDHIASCLKEQSVSATRVVELGCGGKQYRSCFQGQYFGLDLNQGYYPGEGPDILGDAQSLPFLTGSVDLVFFVATLCAIPDTGKVLAECHRILRKGGRLLVFDYTWWVSRRLLDSRHHFTTWTLSRQLRRHGFCPRTHWLCVPSKGPVALQPLLGSAPARFLTYLASNWIVLSGRKGG